MPRHIAVAVSLPRLELDRTFTYRLPDDVEAPLGTLVSVPFHGRTVKGWSLGPTDDVPARVLPIRRALSRVPVFDEAGLRLCRWMAERYVAPLSTVIGRAHPPRVASEEGKPRPPVARETRPPVGTPPVLRGYGGGAELLRALADGAGAFVVRPLPAEEVGACVEAVGAALAAGRSAAVLVPEVTPMPAAAAALLEAFGSEALLFAGGERRERYAAWLDLLAGRYRVVVGTRPAVFAPLGRLGLVWVHREAHAAHREERAPYHHVREVALARARLEGAVCVLAGLSPSAEAIWEAERGAATVVRAPRAAERAAAPVVEVSRPEGEDRSPRLSPLLAAARGAFLLISRRGYGVARVCRSCKEPARCDACSGIITVSRGVATCTVCDRAARCPVCGSTDFGVERRGIERVEEWARHVSGLPVERIEEGDEAVPPAPDRVLVGTSAAVKDFGPRRVGLVAVLDPDRALRRAGLASRERTLATWMEAAAWAGGRDGGGRVLVQTAEPRDAAVQALVRWDPWHFHRDERARRTEAGFPPGHPVFRLRGTPALEGALSAVAPVHLLATSLGDEAVCLVTLRPESIPEFRSLVRGLAEKGTVTRVEAEPQL
ncbi:MAG TPA: hypothetical protein VGB51_10715 [Actinomycetota bacterium]